MRCCSLISTNLEKQSPALPKSVLAPISNTFTACPGPRMLLAQPAPLSHTTFPLLQSFQGCQTMFPLPGLGGEQSLLTQQPLPAPSPVQSLLLACAILTPLPHHMAQAHWEDSLGQTHPFLLGSRYKDTQIIVCSYCKGKAGGKGSREGRKLH